VCLAQVVDARFPPCISTGSGCKTETWLRREALLVVYNTVRILVSTRVHASSQADIAVITCSIEAANISTS